MGWQVRPHFWRVRNHISTLSFKHIRFIVELLLSTLVWPIYEFEIQKFQRKIWVRFQVLWRIFFTSHVQWFSIQAMTAAGTSMADHAMQHQIMKHQMAAAAAAAAAAGAPAPAPAPAAKPGDGKMDQLWMYPAGKLTWLTGKSPLSTGNTSSFMVDFPASHVSFRQGIFNIGNQVENFQANVGLLEG